MVSVSVVSMHNEVQKRTEQDGQIDQDAERVGPVFGEE
jgi:hypothetical protein